MRSPHKKLWFLEATISPRCLLLRRVGSCKKLWHGALINDDCRRQGVNYALWYFRCVWARSQICLLWCCAIIWNLDLPILGFLLSPVLFNQITMPNAVCWMRTVVSRLIRRSVNSPKGDFQKLQTLSINSPSPADEANQRFPSLLRATGAKPERFVLKIHKLCTMTNFRLTRRSVNSPILSLTPVLSV